ncbi:MAG TPA: hypothetical protein VKM72_36215 [Thermoanaerobaculia bacterium]|nr:hypothetical protein [Thermoanaerobaculia bacterium]
MADVKIIASPDFPEQTAELVTCLDSLLLGIRGKGEAQSEKIDLKEHLESVAIQTEDEIRNLLGAAGWGLVGSFLLGPTGLLLGALWGARKQKEICFDARFKDGRKFLGIADAPTFQKLKAVTFR